MGPELEQAVQAVAETAHELKLDIVLVGALMAEFTPEIESDYPRFRRTNDADFAVSVKDWQAYGTLRDELIKRKFEQDSKIEHRLRRASAIVDLIPYGSQIAPDGKLVWPESGFQMTVTGLGEACAAAREAESKNQLAIPVVTVPGFVLLKIIAYLDRKAKGDPSYKDDARDIEYWLRNYASGTKDDRRFGLAGIPELAETEYETAGAALLGIEVGNLASADSAAYIERFLSESENLYSPFMDAIAAGELDEAADRKRREGLALLSAFKSGYLHARKDKR